MQMATDTESRISKVEGILEQMSARLDNVEAGITEVRREIGEVRNNQQNNFRWTIGTVVIMWVSIIVAILLA